MRHRRSARLILAGLALCWPWLSSARTFEFLYIDANEGQASGGHAAIQFGEEVFHFQHVEPGLLRIFRSDVQAFRFAYGFQENRSIAGHAITVDDAVYTTLHAAFNHRLQLQNQHFKQLKALQEDDALLHTLGQAANRTIPLPGLGYFVEHYRFGQDPPMNAKPSAELHALKQAVLSAYGDSFLHQKRQQTLSQLLALTPSTRASEKIVDEARFDTAGSVFARQYQNQLLNLAALDILEWCLSLRDGALLMAPSPAYRLPAQASAVLRGFQQTLFDDLLTLLQSQRSDWGYALLVGMARLQALQASIDASQWRVLDRFQRDNLTDKSVRLDRQNRQTTQHYADRNLAMAGEKTSATGFGEREYNDLEIKAGVAIKLAAIEPSEPVFRLPAVDETPALSAAVTLVDLPLPAGALVQYQSDAKARLHSYQTSLQTVYPYQLLRHNCVTEIFRVIHASLANTDAGSADNATLAQLSTRYLGGYIEATAWNSIPFAAFAEVSDHYRINSHYQLPSYREQAIERLYQTDARLWVDLKESNVLTSSIYHWHGDDAAFLFFTQDTIWPRPVLGSLNLSVALGQAVYGLLALPWDSGQQLQKGLKGLAVSLPELFFFNIRKGSFPYLLPTAWAAGSTDDGE